jgi:hypothetical protein
MTLLGGAEVWRKSRKVEKTTHLEEPRCGEKAEK